jgi:DNA-directed RNA polymerase subunit D
MAKVTKLEQSKDKLTIRFAAEGESVAYVNTLRRAVMDYVPTLAVEDLEIRKNSSVLYDEIIAHRIGLLPITTEPGSYTFRVEGETGLGSELKLTLSVKGPGYVYAEELKSKDSKAKPAQPKMIIGKLLKGQEIELEATAILGRGIEHAKWAPGQIYYEYNSEVKVNNKAKELDQFITKFPPQVVDNGKISKEKIIKLELMDACEGVCPEVVDVQYNSDSLKVTVESWGQMPAKLMVKEGCKYIAEALDDFADAVKALK